MWPLAPPGLAQRCQPPNLRSPYPATTVRAIEQRTAGRRAHIAHPPRSFLLGSSGSKPRVSTLKLSTFDMSSIDLPCYLISRPDVLRIILPPLHPPNPSHLLFLFVPLIPCLPVVLSKHFDAILFSFHDVAVPSTSTCKDPQTSFSCRSVDICFLSRSSL